MAEADRLRSAQFFFPGAQLADLRRQSNGNALSPEEMMAMQAQQQQQAQQDQLRQQGMNQLGFQMNYDRNAGSPAMQSQGAQMNRISQGNYWLGGGGR